MSPSSSFSLALLALLALLLGSAAQATAIAPELVDTIDFSSAPEGYRLVTGAGVVDLAKNGYLLIVDWAAGRPADPGDDTFFVQNTLSFLDATVRTKDNPYWDGPDAPLALGASLRSLSAPNPSFGLLREADASVLDRTPAPLDLYVGDDGVDVGYDFLDHREAGANPLPYPTTENADLPVGADADSVDLPATWQEDTDTWLVAMDQVVGTACTRTSDEFGMGAPCSDLRAFSGMQDYLPNVVLHNELQAVGVHVNPNDPGTSRLDLPLVGLLGPTMAGGNAAALPPAGPDEALHTGADDALPADIAAQAAGPNQGSSDLGPEAVAFGSPSQTDALLAVLVIAAGAGLALLAVPLYRRIVRGKVLENDVRGRILALVQAKPGLHESAVAKELSISHTLAQYHVRMLAEFGLVEVRRFGGRKCLFAAGQMGRGEKTMLLAEHGRGAQVVDLVAAQPGIAQRELARALGIRESSVKWHLDRLEQAGVLTITRSIDGKRVRLSDEAEHTRMASFTRVGPASVPISSPAVAPAGPAAPQQASTAAPPVAEA